MSWIDIIPYEDAKGKLKEYYDRMIGPSGKIDNIMRVHSIRPHTLHAHMVLYKNVLHHSENKISKDMLETLGTYVSHLNRCYYCVEHHFAGLKKLLKNDERAAKIRQALETDNFNDVFGKKELALLHYAKLLTVKPYEIQARTLENLRELGYTDGEILECNQVVAYFSYANRTVLGLGVNTKGDELGLSPNSNDSEDWSHS